MFDLWEFLLYNFIMQSIIIILLSLLICSCSSMNEHGRLSDYDLDASIRNKQYSIALNELRLREKETKDKDKILILLDQAIVLHYNKEYEASNNILLKIKKTIEYKFLSFGEKINKYYFSNNINKFSLEPHEELFVQHLISINYAFIGKINESLVEAKSWDYSISQNNSSDIFSKSNNMYLSYMSGLFYELNGYNYDALIDYKRVLSNSSYIPYAPYDLVRIQSKINEVNKSDIIKYDIEEKYLSKIKNSKNEGEIIIYFLNGIGPYKEESPNNSSVPIYKERLKKCDNAKIYINNQDYGQTITIFDISKASKDLLAAKYKQMAFESLGKILAKESVSLPLNIMSMGGYSILSRLILYGSGGIDFRSWKYMPAEVQFARIPISKGVYFLKIKMNDDIVSHKITVKAGKATFVGVNYQEAL